MMSAIAKTLIRWRLRELMARQKVSVVAIAGAMGVSRATASKIKNADLMPSNLDHDKLNALCRYLGVTPSDLLEYVPDESA